MKKTLGPSWSKEEVAAGARSFAQWDTFFAARAPGSGNEAVAAQPLSSEAARIADLQARHEAELLRLPNVVAIAPGFRMRGGAPTDEACLVVYVQRKIPARRLAAAERVPKQIEGVPIDVVEVGPIGVHPA